MGKNSGQSSRHPRKSCRNHNGDLWTWLPEEDLTQLGVARQLSHPGREGPAQQQEADPDEAMQPPIGTAWRLGGSGSNRFLRKRIVGMIKSLSEAGAERPVVDSTANLQRQISPSSRPTHLLRFLHPTVHREVGGAFGDCGADPQAGPVPFGIIDQPFALVGECLSEKVGNGIKRLTHCW